MTYPSKPRLDAEALAAWENSRDMAAGLEQSVRGARSAQSIGCGANAVEVRAEASSGVGGAGLAS
jgi:hypothetical protein